MFRPALVDEVERHLNPMKPKSMDTCLETELDVATITVVFQGVNDYN